MKKLSVKLSFFIGLFLTFPSAFAQYTLYEYPINQKYIEYYVSKPKLENSLLETKSVSHVGVISTQFFCQSKYCFFAELPYVYADFKYAASNSPFIESEDNFTLGNPLLGMRKNLDSVHNMSISLSLPNVSNNNGFRTPIYGSFTRVDQLEMFLPETTSLSIDSLIKMEGSSLTPFFKIGFIGWKLDPDVTLGDEYELLNRYEIGFNVDQSLVFITAKIKGVTILTESNIDLSDRNINFFTFAIKLKTLYQPGFYFMKQLDNELDGLEYTIGIGLTSSF